MSTASTPVPYKPGAQPRLPGGDQKYLTTQLQAISASVASILTLMPQVATVAPAAPADGMMRLARSPWNPITGITADCWVYYSAPAAAWLQI